MTYWIYNMGLAVPVSSQRLLDKRKVLPLSKLAKNHALRSNDENNDENITLTSHVHKPTEGYDQIPPPQPKQLYLAEQIMSTPVKTLPEELSFSEAWQHFLKERFRHFPVINKQGGLVGILSDRDMLTHAATGKPTKVKISQLMKNPVLTASGHTAIREVCQVMFSQHIGALPIIDDKGELIGMITRSDILRSMIEHGPVELWA
jgi:acetoin utilization protein AcuB